MSITKEEGFHRYWWTLVLGHGISWHPPKFQRRACVLPFLLKKSTYASVLKQKMLTFTCSLPNHTLHNPWIKRQQPENKNELVLKLETNIRGHKSRHNTEGNRLKKHQIDDLKINQDCISTDPLTPKIKLLILPSSSFIFLSKLVTRIWCWIKITTTVRYIWVFSLPVCWIMIGYYKEKFHVNHLWKLKG